MSVLVLVLGPGLSPADFDKTCPEWGQAYEAHVMGHPDSRASDRVRMSPNDRTIEPKAPTPLQMYKFRDNTLV